ncbi:MAG TPA: hypothetical protein VJ718_11115, partial [Candidatus Binataceae bacterium]|nr:hypothetical protein [Candidatus Binataceae bacterium]
MNRRPAIIVFAREPMAGAVKTRLIPRIGSNNAAALADAFLRDALVKARTLSTRLAIAATTPEGAARSGYFRAMAKRFGADLLDQGDGHLGVRMRRAL